VSLFITDLAFTDPGLIDQAKVGILTASVAAGVIGTVLLLMAPAGTGAHNADPPSRPAPPH
jgi:NhaA family Na+:H+ antiporter